MNMKSKVSGLFENLENDRSCVVTWGFSAVLRPSNRDVGKRTNGSLLKRSRKVIVGIGYAKMAHG